jgi:single-stranded-DNA-specific exonuclease
MNWEKKDVPAELVREIAKKFDCDLLVASILARRGITAGEAIQYFLEDDLRYLRNPFELPAMDDAVDRILAALDEGEKVLVFGDRDVDGITSTTLIVGLLMDLGMDVTWRVPTGDDAYGLSIAAVEEFAANYGSLIITVDCGISNIQEVARAKELGIDVIVVDHHNPPNELPQALAIVNPKLPTSTYPFRDLSGCGVTYKLASALRFAQKGNLYGQPICLLNTRPTNDAYVIEAVKLRNLVVIDRITETVIPGMVSFEQTRLLPFLQGQQILVWDAALQRKTIAKIFGGGIEINMLDLAPEIAKEIPSTAGKSLLKIKELSRIAKYAEKSPGELDVFINLFISFAQRRESFYSSADAGDLQLAALGTVADLMPLRDENRIIVRLGIEGLNKNSRPGISDLLFKIGLSGRRISATEVSWQICPAINATGRMGSPETAVRLFLSKDKNEQNELAGAILQMNEDRKKLGNDIWTVVEPLAQASLDTFAGKLVLAYGTEIHRGVSGIMANRLVSRFKTPAVVVSFNGSSIATGSLRSTRGYDLRALLEQCADLFLDWGGHDFAAGFSMERKNWDAFIERLKLAAVGIELEENEDEEKLSIDAELPLQFLTPDIFKVVDRFEPYGEGNEPLIFMTRGAKITDLALMGKPEIKHVKLSLDTGKFKWPAVYWQAAEKVKREFDINDSVDLVFRLNRNWFNGNEIPQLIVSDIKRTDHGQT